MKQTILKRSAVILSILLMGFTAFAQNRPLSGKVVDQNGEPIVGASIMVVGNSTIGTVTDVDGNYNFNVPVQASVTVSCIGYSSQTVSVACTKSSFSGSSSSMSGQRYGRSMSL